MMKGRTVRVVCEKCGREMWAHVFSRHQRVCDLMPVPAELVRLFFADDALTMVAMGEQYGVNPALLKRHMCHAIERDVLDAELKRRKVARGRIFGEARKSKKWKKRGALRKCKVCTAWLDHPQVMDCGELCGECSGKVPKLMPAVFDYAPDVVEWW